MIKIESVTKYFGGSSKPAVDNVSLTFERGKIYGLLGRNGAGKTTLINLITNRIMATSGSVTIGGLPARENDNAQEKVFCMTEKGCYPPDMHVRTCVKWVAQFYPAFDTAYAMTLLDKCRVDIKKRIRALSTGYGSIVKLIVTLASNAEVMIFDEPTLGLDANMRDFFYHELLEKYESLQNTMILSTHLIGEIEGLLERVVIIDAGKILVDSDLESLSTRAVVVTGLRENAERFAQNKKVLHREQMGGFSAVTIDGALSTSDRKAAAELKLEISGAKLQEIFIKLTNAADGEETK